MPLLLPLLLLQSASASASASVSASVAAHGPARARAFVPDASLGVAARLDPCGLWDSRASSSENCVPPSCSDEGAGKGGRFDGCGRKTTIRRRDHRAAAAASWDVTAAKRATLAARSAPRARRKSSDDCAAPSMRQRSAKNSISLSACDAADACSRCSRRWHPSVERNSSSIAHRSRRSLQQLYASGSYHCGGLVRRVVAMVGAGHDMVKVHTPF